MFTRCTVKSIALALLSLLFIASAGHRLAYAEESADWTVSEITGQVMVKQDNRVGATVAHGDHLATGSMVLTQWDAHAVLTRGATSMTISPNSEITLAAEGEGSALTKIFQRVGNVLYKVKKQNDQHFEVNTPFLSAVVKGTSFSIGVNDGSAVTHVVEGAVEVTSLESRQKQLVRPGQTITVSNTHGMELGVPRGHRSSESNDQVINRTLGATSIDIANVTDGLAYSSASGADIDNTAADVSNGVDVGISADSRSVGVSVSASMPASGGAGGMGVGTAVGGTSIGGVVGGSVGTVVLPVPPNPLPELLP